MSLLFLLRHSSQCWYWLMQWLFKTKLVMPYQSIEKFFHYIWLLVANGHAMNLWLIKMMVLLSIWIFRDPWIIKSISRNYRFRTAYWLKSSVNGQRLFHKVHPSGYWAPCNPYWCVASNWIGYYHVICCKASQRLI